MVVWHDFSSTLSLFFAKSNSLPTLVDLIFPPYLIYSRDTYLILPTYLHVHSHTFFIFLRSALFIIMISFRNKEDSYLLVGRWTIFLSQLEGNLGPN